MPAPTLTSISPNVGATVGGAAVTLTGANFAGTTGVTIGGVACTSVVVVSDTSITCVTPAGSAGDASVVVTNGSGSNASNSLWIYLPTVPADIYVYLKGGRGDGFVPGYTGVYVDEVKTEKSPGFRNAHQTVVTTPSGSVSYPGVVSNLSNTVTSGPNGVIAPVINTTTTTIAVTGTPNDIAANTAPRQWERSVTWRRYIGEGGIEYPFRLDLIVGIGSRKRGI